jgi:hypothetical protein
MPSRTSAGAHNRARLTAASGRRGPALVAVVLGMALVMGLATRRTAVGIMAAPRAAYAPARLSAAASVRAAGRGSPHTSLADGHDLLTDYAGQGRLVNSLITDQAEPLSLASADFDEDGVTVPSGPSITGAARDGKHLIVTGLNFANGARVLVNDEQRKTIFDSAARLIGKKVGKTIQPGDRVRVRNPDGGLSNEVVYPSP